MFDRFVESMIGGVSLHLNAMTAGTILVAGIGVSGIFDGQQATVAPIVPELREAALPVYPPIAIQAKIVGDAQVEVATDGNRPTRVAVSGAYQLIREAAEAAIRTWRFAPHSPTTFQSTLRFSPHDLDYCFDADVNPHVSFRFPTEILIQGAFQGTCFRRAAVIEDTQIRIPALRGVVACDCPEGQPIEKVVIATELPTRRGTRYVSFETDDRGRFDFGSARPGTYVLDISKWGYSERRLLVLVNPQDGSGVANVTLKPDPRYKPRPAATVRDARVAFYPEQARMQQIEGTVRVRVLAEGRAELIDGLPQLSEAAVANARTWTFVRRPERPFDVEYRYRLLPGDCSPNQNPTISMRFPSEVEITAKRRIPCGHVLFSPPGR